MFRRALLLAFSFAVGSAIAACSGIGASPGASQPAAGTPASAAVSAAGSGAVITVLAVEYEFQGVPGTFASGTSLALMNNGTELHELVLIRRNADATLSLDELLKLPQADSAKFITTLGGVMAPPGSTAEGSVTADQPGEYALICFIPQGTTALPSGGATLPPGPPHFILGMLKLVTVT